MHSKSSLLSRSNTRGFTVIEVLIVLAVAGFIFTVILLVVPTLQKNSRNYQRKHTVELIAAGMEQHKTNYGDYPRTEEEFDQLLENMPEINKGPVQVDFHGTGHGHDHWPAPDRVAIQYAHWCNVYGNGNNDTDPIAGDDANASFYAVWVQLEPDGTEPENRNTFCVDNYYQ